MEILKNEFFLLMSSFLWSLVFGALVLIIGEGHFGSNPFLILAILGTLILVMNFAALLMKNRMLFILTILVFSFWLIASLLKPSPLVSLNPLVVSLTWILSILAMGFSYSYGMFLEEKRARKRRRKKPSED